MHESLKFGHFSVLKIFTCRLIKEKSKKVCKYQELKQSEPKSSPQNQNGKQPILQIVKIQREHMVNRVSSHFSKGGHPATETELKNNINTH